MKPTILGPILLGSPQTTIAHGGTYLVAPCSETDGTTEAPVCVRARGNWPRGKISMRPRHGFSSKDCPWPCRVTPALHSTVHIQRCLAAQGSRTGTSGGCPIKWGSAQGETARTTLWGYVSWHGETSLARPSQKLLTLGETLSRLSCRWNWNLLLQQDHVSPLSPQWTGRPGLYPEEVWSYWTTDLLGPSCSVLPRRQILSTPSHHQETFQGADDPAAAPCPVKVP